MSALHEYAMDRLIPESDLEDCHCATDFVAHDEQWFACGALLGANEYHAFGSKVA